MIIPLSGKSRAISNCGADRRTSPRPVPRFQGILRSRIPKAISQPSLEVAIAEGAGAVVD